MKKKMYVNPQLEVKQVNLRTQILAISGGSNVPDPTPAPRRPHGGDIIP